MNNILKGIVVIGNDNHLIRNGGRAPSQSMTFRQFAGASVWNGGGGQAKLECHHEI